MPWKPKFPPVPPHPAQQFDSRAAALDELGGGTVGHLLMFAEPYAWQDGHLWWKTFSETSLTLEIWTYINGQFHETFLFEDGDVDAAVEGLQRGEWQADGAASTAYPLRWLDRDESCRVAAAVFGADLQAERRRRKRLD